MPNVPRRSDIASGTAWALVLVGVLFSAPPPLAGQSPDMNFFLAVEGATWGADRAPVGVSDTHCHDLAYPQGYGHLTWRAYLTGTAADGEEDEIARGRIGEGPWYNYYGFFTCLRPRSLADQLETSLV